MAKAEPPSGTKAERTAAARPARQRRKQPEQALVLRDVPSPTAVTPNAVPDTVAHAQVLPPARVARAPFLAAAVFLLGLVAAAVGLWLNASFLWTFGRTTEAGIVLAVIGLVTDAVTLIMPCVIAALWLRDRHAFAITAVTVYLLAVAMTALTSLGFANQNIGDAVTGRRAAVLQRTAIHEDIGRLKAERSSLHLVPASEAGVTAATIARDQECGRVGPNCRQRVAELAATLKDKALTDRAAELDGKIAALEVRLASLPTIASADPQIDGAVAVITWLSRSIVTPTTGDIEMVRLIGVAAIPVLAGLMLAFAMALAQPVYLART